MDSVYIYDDSYFLPNVNMQSISDFQMKLAAALPNNILDVVEWSPNPLAPADPARFVLTFYFEQPLSTDDFATMMNFISTYQYFFTNISQVIDSKPSGTNGGTFTAGSWQLRDLNHLTNMSNSNVITFNNNQFTLIPGEYTILISCPAFGVGNHQARLVNVTNGKMTYGSPEYSFSYYGSGATSRSWINSHITLAVPCVFEIQHRCSITNPTVGFGIAAGFGGNEVYTSLYINQVFVYQGQPTSY
jgi:hypothetical protein